MDNLNTRYAKIFETLMSPLVKSIQPVHKEYTTHPYGAESFLKITMVSDDPEDREALIYHLQLNSGGETLVSNIKDDSFWFRLLSDEDRKDEARRESLERYNYHLKLEHCSAMFFQALITKDGLSSYSTNLGLSIQLAEHFLKEMASKTATK